MILEFELNDWIVLKNIFVTINEIIDEIVIECNPEGLNFKGIDRSHVCFFKGVFSKSLFENYSIDKILYLYIDLNELVKVLKRGNNKDNFILKADTDVIKIIFKNKNKRTFTITQLDIQDDMRDVPKLDYSVNFNCDFDVIKNSLKDADLYSDRLTFTCENDMMVLSCDGTNGNYENECQLINIDGGDCSATYSVNWLSKIFNNKLGSHDLKIYMGDDYPMLIEMGLDSIKMNYLIAPRLEQ